MRLHCVNANLGILRYLIGIADTSEFRNNPFASLGIQALAVAALTDIKRRRNMNLDKSAVLLDEVTHGTARRVQW